MSAIVFIKEEMKTKIYFIKIVNLQQESSGHVWMWDLDHKKAKHRFKIDPFEL